MAEALVAVAVTSIAGAALLTSVGAAVRTATDTTHVAMARGLAEQLMDEIAAGRFPESTNPAPGGTGRENFDDIDDYDGWSARPPQDKTGRAIGTEGDTVLGVDMPRPDSMQPDRKLLGRFTRQVEVERIRPNGAGGWVVVSAHTSHRRVTVRVSYSDGQSNTSTLAVVTRIFSYVPPSP